MSEAKKKKVDSGSDNPRPKSKKFSRSHKGLGCLSDREDECDSMEASNKGRKGLPSQSILDDVH